ncbi:MAG: FAD-dependent oxidoreductase [Oscillospiraceae bacterium]|nr:FAD-dependent oxidoreductase [Oscillospiraceae bacterium]
MNYLILGGVAAGTKAAAKIKRGDRSAQVRIFTKGKDISYAGCGLPYYLGGVIDSRDELIVNTPEKFAGLTGAEVLTGCEAVALNASKKCVTVLHASGARTEETYDKLIIATGAEAFVPPVAGMRLPGVFCIRTPDDVSSARAYVEQQGCRRAVVCGAGFIGLETAENLMAQGLDVTVIDAAAQVLPNAFDAEMADFIKRRLKKAGLRVMTGVSLLGVTGAARAEAVSTDAGSLPADLVIVAIGVRPATKFLEGSGLDLFKGTIVVDEALRTNLPDVYAVGDCALVRSEMTGKGQWSAMGSTANLTARTLAKTLTGTPTPYGGCLGTGVARLLPDLNAGRTGLTEQQAAAAGFDAVSALCVLDDKPNYYPGASSFTVKLVADRATHRLLGIQVLGAGAVDKMTDIAVLGISKQAAIEEFDTMDFAYAPPFSTAIHPFATACYVLENKLSGELGSFTPAQYTAGAAAGYAVIDTHPEPKIPGARWVDLTKVNGPIEGLEKDAKLLLVCAKGKRSYFLQNRLKAFGYTNTRVLEGGTYFSTVKAARPGGALPPEEIKRVKGLGCLMDRRYGDVFNVRVITRNGKLTAAEQRTVAEAAEKFGSGEVTMTTRLTLEVQGVPYDNLDALMEYLKDNGLETGGTGSKVRPVVSCKGTTCQYGLIDTFDLSEKLHQRFYQGYHGVVLPHKFKIAVGGCPNNCVKPDLNDLGVIGQSVPEIDPAKCRGCAACRIEKTCPIHIAAVKDGKIRIDPAACNHCGRCVGSCPFGAIGEAQRGYKVYLGGRWGKKTAQGRALDRIFTSEEEVMDLVERAILLFRDKGVSGERFADTVARLGFETVQEMLLSGGIDRDAALKKDVIGGATC